VWRPRGGGAAAPPEGYRERVAAVTDSWASRFAVFDAALERWHPAGPHQYLAILAVRPDRQGHGTGTALLRARHEVLDWEPGTVASLEASSRRVRQLYLAHGYVDHGVPIQLPSGPAMYPMIRQPRSPRSKGGSGTGDPGTGEGSRRPSGAGP
jgi:GNAT superfamily N-acetyltransferase